MPKVAIATATMLAVGLVGSASSEQRTANNYRFEVVDMEVGLGWDAEVRVRLIHLPDERLVSGAVIYDHRFELLMSVYKVVTSRMVEGATPPLDLSVDEGNGVYRILSALPLQGDWRATLTARVPGEVLPVRGSVALRAR